MYVCANPCQCGVTQRGASVDVDKTLGEKRRTPTVFRALMMSATDVRALLAWQLAGGNNNNNNNAKNFSNRRRRSSK